MGMGFMPIRDSLACTFTVRILLKEACIVAA
jgi:hypothetical protein